MESQLFHEHAALLDKREIGDYLGGYAKPGSSDMSPRDVREAYVAWYDFSGMTFVAALRVFLNGFQLPGESILIGAFLCNP